MKLEVGMYVRLENDIEDIVVINKIANVFETTILTENDVSIYQGEYTKENVVKASYDIIDLIEVGDYVNGYKVSLKGYDYAHFVQCDYPVENGTTNHYKFYKQAIKSVVTKELFEIAEYRIGEYL